jgi:hypothetical protein
MVRVVREAAALASVGSFVWMVCTALHFIG